MIIAAFYILGFQPVLESVKHSNELLSQRQQELGKIEKQIIEFKAAQADLSRATFKNDIYGSIVDRENLSVVIEDLERAAESTNTTETIQIQEEQKSDARRPRSNVAETTTFSGLALSEEVTYTMSISNDFAGFVNFMQYLENLPHFTEYSDISLNAFTTNTDGGGTRNTGGVIGTLEGVFLVNKPDPNEEKVQR